MEKIDFSCGRNVSVEIVVHPLPHGETPSLAKLTHLQFPLFGPAIAKWSHRRVSSFLVLSWGSGFLYIRTNKDLFIDFEAEMYKAPL